jgi:YbgC/YbaW family acyl-CoA thioester hydrolase
MFLWQVSGWLNPPSADILLLMEYHSQVFFDDTDAGGIVFFGNYFRLAHRALEACLPSVGIPWKDWFASEEIGVPLRHVESDYRYPLFPGEKFRMKISVLHLGESSVQFQFEIFNSKEALTTVLKTTHVFVSAATKKKTAIPPAIRTKLEKL